MIEELSRIAFFDIRKAFRPDGTLMSVDEMDQDARAVIISLDVTDLQDREGNPTGRMSKIKLADKLGALTLLMRHLGLLNDKLKIQGDAENPLVLLIKEIQGNAIRPVQHPIIEDEENRAHRVQRASNLPDERGPFLRWAAPLYFSGRSISIDRAHPK